MGLYPPRLGQCLRLLVHQVKTIFQLCSLIMNNGARPNGQARQSNETRLAKYPKPNLYGEAQGA